MGNKLKYSEFYYKLENKIISINKLDKSSYLLYENNMFCPDCHEAELYFVYNINTPHLRTKPSSYHYTSCSYKYKEADNNTTKRYFTTLSDTQIKNKLNSIMRYLCTEKHNRKAQLENLSEEQNPMLISKSTQKSKTYYALRRKSLGVFFEKEDIGEFYAFYGKAYLEVADYSDYAFLQIKIGNKKISIYRSKQHIPKDIDENAPYHIVCIGHLENWELTKKIQFKIELCTPNSLIYQKIDKDII